MIRITTSGSLSIIEQMELLSLSPTRRRRLLGTVGKAVVKASRQAIREQRSPDGQAWTKRKKGKKRMLRRMAKGLQAKPTPDQVTVTWSNALTARIAAKHQYGLSESYTAGKVRKGREKTNPDDPVTRNQAKLLRQLGYTIAAGKNGSRTRRPGMSWIMSNLTAGQAGLALKALIAGKREAAASKKSWTINLDARPFLGIQQAQVTDLLRKELNRNRRG